MMVKYARCENCNSMCFREIRTQNIGVKLTVDKYFVKGECNIRPVVRKSKRIAPEVKYFCEKCGNKVKVDDETYFPLNGGLKL